MCCLVWSNEVQSYKKYITYVKFLSIFSCQTLQMVSILLWNMVKNGSLKAFAWFKGATPCGLSAGLGLKGYTLLIYIQASTLYLYAIERNLNMQSSAHDDVHTCLEY